MLHLLLDSADSIQNRAKISLQYFCVYEKNVYICTQTLGPCALMLEATRAGQSVAKPLQVKPYEAGIGRERESRHNGRRLL